MARADLASEAWREARRQQGDSVQGTDPALERTGAEGRGHPRRRMGCVQSYPPQSSARLDARLPGVMEGSGLGLVALGTARKLWGARQPARRRRIRELPRPQARPRNAAPPARWITARIAIR